MVDPLGSDCSGANFEAALEGVHLAWYRASTFMVGLFVTLFLVAVAVRGYCILGCVLLTCAPATNLFNFYRLTNELESVSTESAMEKEALQCAQSNTLQVYFFLVLCLVALSSGIMARFVFNEDLQQDAADDNRPSSERSPLL